MSNVESKEVFISYSTKDADQAQYLCNLLEGAGISCWMAPRDIPVGKSWAESIVDGLRNCKLVVFLLSEKSLASSEIAKEIDLANTFQKGILQVRIEDAPLTGALQYHLSTKQWVDAYQGEKSVRYLKALEAVFIALKRSGDTAVDPSSILGQARTLSAKITKEHAKALDRANSVFTAHQDAGSNTVYLKLPLRIGDTGVNLVSAFNQKTKAVHIYADGASDGDVLKDPFGQLMEREFKERFTKFAWKDRGRRWAFVSLIPETPISHDLLLETDSPELYFPRFADQVNLLALTVIPRLLAWGGYASDVMQSVDRISDRLKDVYPESEGWRIGAPEGVRLRGCRANGLINVSKRTWAPPEWEDYKHRGLLSITLQADGDFLKGLKVGVVKYESWHDLGEWEQRLHDEGKQVLGRNVVKSNVWPFVAAFESEWRDSGLACAGYSWQGKLAQFEDYVVAEFVKLKALTPLLDLACAAIPAIQDRTPESLPTNSGWGSALYVRNRLRTLADTLQQRCDGNDVKVKYRYRDHEWICSELILTVQIGTFDTAVTFRFNAHFLEIALINLVPPDFESSIVREFFQKNHPDLSYSGIPRSEVRCHGLSVVEWMDRLQAVIEEHFIGFSRALGDLAIHLHNCVALVNWVTDTLRVRLTSETGWVIDNKRALDLEAGEGILVYQQSWRGKGHASDELPPIVVQIVPNRPCFDELVLAIKLISQPIAQVERALGRIVGASEYAFGPSERDDRLVIKELWTRRLGEPLQTTNGSRFERSLPSEAERPAMVDQIDAISNAILRMTPILAEATGICSDVHFQTQFESVVKGLSSKIKGIYPEAEGWSIEVQTTPDARWGGIRINRDRWKMVGVPGVQMRIGLGAFGKDWHDLYFGVCIEQKAHLAITAERIAKINAEWQRLFNKIEKAESRWVFWSRPEKGFDSVWTNQGTLIAGPARENFISYYTDIFSKLKQLTPMLDDLFLASTALPALESVQSSVSESDA